MEILYEILYTEFLRLVFFNPIMVIALAIPCATSIMLIPLLTGLPLWRIVAFTLFSVSIIIAGLLLLIPRPFYGVDDGYIVISSMGTYKIPLREANVSLVPYDKVKPVFRIAGLALPKVALGRYKFANGKYGIALVYKPEDKAIVIEYRKQVFVISHPGVEKVYKKLIEIMKAVTMRRG